MIKFPIRIKTNKNTELVWFPHDFVLALSILAVFVYWIFTLLKLL